MSFFAEGERDEKDLKDYDESDADTDALIIYTSGTTGVAKGVVTTIGNLFGVPRFYLVELFRINENDKTSHSGYINLPFYHMAGIMAFLAVTQIGQTMCFSKDYRRIAKDVETNDIDVAVVTPAVLKLWKKMLKRGKREKLGGTKFIYVAGAALDLDTVRIFLQNRIGIIQTYGMTETGGDVAMNWEMDKHPTSVGKIPPGVAVKIVDGEILVKSWANMKCYYNNPEETDKILKDGFIHTGDLGYIDDEGYLYITGRKKNLIILSGGENVSPEELEKELYKNEFIEECIVYEDDDRIAAEIYAPKADSDAIKEYIAALNKELPIYKRIYKTVIRESEFEKTALGKIKRS
jgi:long-chain acyl-CoA synthetase